MVQVYDQVNAGTNKPMAAASFDIGECLGARGNTTAKEMKDGGTYVQYDLTCGCSMNTIKIIVTSTGSHYFFKPQQQYLCSCCQKTGMWYVGIANEGNQAHKRRRIYEKK